MDQKIKKFDAIIDNLSSLPKTHMIEKANSHNLNSELHMYTVEYTHKETQRHKLINKVIKI